MFLQPEGIDGHGGATTIGGAAQDTGTRGIVDVQVFVGCASVPTHEVIQQVIGERGRGAAVVTPVSVTASVDSSASIAIVRELPLRQHMETRSRMGRIINPIKHRGWFFLASRRF